MDRLCSQTYGYKIRTDSVLYVPIAVTLLLLGLDTQVRRWHPDKFLQKQGGRIVEEEREEVDDDDD